MIAPQVPRHRANAAIQVLHAPAHVKKFTYKNYNFYIIRLLQSLNIRREDCAR